MAAARYLLQQDTVMQDFTLTDDVVDRHCRKQPVLHRIFVEHLIILDVVLITILAITLDIDVKDILYGILVIILFSFNYDKET